MREGKWKSATSRLILRGARQLYRRIKGLPTNAEVPRDKIWREFPTALPHTHNALDDALEQEEVFRQMLRVAKLI